MPIQLPTSRGALLEEQGREVERLTALRFSFVRQVVTSGVLIGLAGSLGIACTQLVSAETWEDGDGRIVGLTIAILFGGLVGVLAVLARHRIGTSIRERREIRQWRLVDRTPAARHLPAGNLPKSLRTPYDARADSDFQEVARRALAGSEQASWGARVAPLVLLPVAGIVIGAILLAMALLEDWSRSTPVGILASLVILVPAAVHLTTLLRDNFGATSEWVWLADDVARLQAWRTRAATDVAPISPRPRGMPWWLAVGLLLLLAGAVLGTVSGKTIALAVLVVAGIVLWVSCRRAWRVSVARWLCRRIEGVSPGRAVPAEWIDTGDRCAGTSSPAAVRVRGDVLDVATTSGISSWPLAEFVSCASLDSPHVLRRRGIAFVREDCTSVSLVLDDAGALARDLPPHLAVARHDLLMPDDR